MSASARGLLEELGRELASVEQAIRSHRYLAAAPGRESLCAFVGERYTILRSDRRSFAQLAARFPEAPAGDLFIGLAQGEGEALVDHPVNPRPHVSVIFQAEQTRKLVSTGDSMGARTYRMDH